MTEGAAALAGEGYSFLDRDVVGEREVAIVPLYSKKQVVEAGKFLSQEIPESRKQEAIEAFKIAHNWRDAHIRPLTMIRHELVGKLKTYRLKSPTAARLKRMKSIRSKLKKGRLTLYQMQDVGGCRVILPTYTDVMALSAIYKVGDCRHELLKVDDYLLSPKVDGYRCHHLIFKFSGTGEDAVYNRQRLELQIRSQLQHAWATAVEAVGLYRGEDLKGGGGDANWRRFFQLVSSDFAEEEGCAIVPGTPVARRDRHKEIKSLNKKIDAIATLNTFTKVVQYSTDFFVKDAEYYLITYDRENQTTEVSPYDRYSAISNRYINEERGEDQKHAVLVEVDAVEDLKAAYPNYFLDVELFVAKLGAVLA